MSNAHRLHSAIAGLLALLAAAVATATEPIAGFKLEGTKWTYHDGSLSIAGILIKPEGDGPFPAILISHGGGGNAEGFGLQKAREFVKMGLVCIAPDYTNAGAVGGGASRRGGPSRKGGPQVGDEPKRKQTAAENLRRAAACLDILQSLPYVDPQRLAAYGNSMGSFVTVEVAAKAPLRLKAAAITAGGIGSRNAPPAESEATAALIRVPICMLHGTSDTTVSPESSARLKAVLDRNHVPNERHLFEGVGHNLNAAKADEVYALMKAWFIKHGVLKENT